MTLEPEQILPTQANPPRRLSPELRLLLAVLLDGLDVLRGSRPTTREQRENDRLWMTGANARLPFWLLCQAFNLDPDVVREKIREQATRTGNARLLVRPTDGRGMDARKREGARVRWLRGKR